MRREMIGAAATVRQASGADAGLIVELYNQYVLQSTATFEEEPVDAPGMTSRIARIQEAGLPWLIAEIDGEFAGYAYGAPWHGRSAYRHAIEVSIYLDHRAMGQGTGTLLYRALFTALRQRDIKTVIGVIALPNDASVALHEKLGLRKAGQLDRIGLKFGRWIDVGFWQGRLDSQEPDL
ncbi:MAG: GNAT family N-acetyltransferase [Proteobacteria bacterium]|nr:GNAT family N-acetyltransferase [Pseudomonadota bacterium]MDA1300107.1 GNAT family N-acetyltransferase [Pseudomonadota bacterium]